MVGKKVLMVAMQVVLVVSLCPCAAYATSLETADVTAGTSDSVVRTPTELENRGVLLDLENGKTLRTSKFIKGAGKVGYDVKLSGLKVTDAEESGYKKATCTLTYKPDKLSKKKAKKVLKAFAKECKKNPNASSVVFDWWICGGDCWWIVDGQTGENLENPDNSAGVTYTHKWTWSKTKKYKNKSYWFTSSTAKCKLTITYPSDYSDLFFGAGCDPIVRAKFSKADASFAGFSTYLSKGKWKNLKKSYTAKYWETCWFKKAKDTIHFTRIQ